MKIGIFSDVHANIEALTAVFEAFKTERVHEYYCLGDVVGYGASPNECANLIRDVAKVTILGNHDAAVAGRMDYSYYYDAARQALDAHAAELSPENKAWLQQLPYKHRLETIGVDLCHGSPVRLEEFEYIFAPDQARECFEIWDDLAPLTLIGHSHLCKVFELRKSADDETTELQELPAEKFRLDEDAKYIVSVGSVGQPRDYDNRASYTTYDAETREFDFLRVEYDIESAANKIFERKLERNFGHRLFIGV
jgi:diadenosine tetraphosphatase ApaH/serine/threonine PP2A family protein phosphatase